MAFDLSFISGSLFTWMTTFMFWGILLIIFLFVTFGFLILRKRKKLAFPVLEQTDLGGGKVGLRLLKGGWFKSKKTFFGLYDYGGEDVFKTKDGRQVQDASSEDYHDILGKRGLIVQRKGDDPKILVPISSVKLDKESRMALHAIAPADFRDASVKLIHSAEDETIGRLEKFMPYIALALVTICVLISIILIVQMVKHSQAEAKDLILQAGQIVKSGVASNAP